MLAADAPPACSKAKSIAYKHTDAPSAHRKPRLPTGSAPEGLVQLPVALSVADLDASGATAVKLHVRLSLSGKPL